MSTLHDTTNEVLALAAKHFKVPLETLSPDDDFFKTLRIEQYFHIELPDYELQGVSDFRTLAERIQSRL
jgi:acyl carrier protein